MGESAREGYGSAPGFPESASHSLDTGRETNMNIQNIEDIIKQAFKIEQDKKLRYPAGTIIAHQSDRMAYELLRYEGDEAVVSHNNIEKRFPAQEIVNINTVKDIVCEIYTCGSYAPDRHIMIKL